MKLREARFCLQGDLREGVKPSPTRGLGGRKALPYKGIAGECGRVKTRPYRGFEGGHKALPYRGFYRLRK
jgi:hypothetical protein